MEKLKEDDFNKQFFNYLKADSDTEWVNVFIKKLITRDIGTIEKVEGTKEILGKSPDGSFYSKKSVVFVENKITASLENDQLLEYGKILIDKYPNKEKYLLFLSPYFGINKPQLDKFRSVFKDNIQLIEKKWIDVYKFLILKTVNSPKQIQELVKNHSKGFAIDFVKENVSPVMSHLIKSGLVRIDEEGLGGNTPYYFNRYYINKNGYRVIIGLDAKDTNAISLKFYSIKYKGLDIIWGNKLGESTKKHNLPELYSILKPIKDNFISFPFSIFELSGENSQFLSKEVEQSILKLNSEIDQYLNKL